jgi:hypothetical protein
MLKKYLAMQEKAKRLIDDHDLEVWNRHRFVTKLNHKSKQDCVGPILKDAARGALSICAGTMPRINHANALRARADDPAAPLRAV